MQRCATPQEVEDLVRRFGWRRAGVLLRRRGFIPPIAGAADPAVVNNVTVGVEVGAARGTAGDPMQCPSFAATGGNTIVVLIRYWTGTPAAPVDTAGNTYTNVAAASGSGGVSWSVWVAQGITGHATNVVQENAANPGLTYASIHVYEVSNVASTNVIDAAVKGAGLTSPTFSTAQAPEMVLMLCSSSASDASASTDLRIDNVVMTLGSYTIPSGQGTRTTQSGYLLEAGTLSNVTGTFQNTLGNVGMSIVSLKGGESVPTAGTSQSVSISDTPAVQVVGGSVEVADIQYCGSGASNLGGAIAGVLTGGAANNVWDDVSGGESTSGDTEYRCIYVKNASGATWQNVVLWVDQQPSPDGFDIALDSAAVGSTAASTSATESDAPTGGGAPYTFARPATRAAGTVIGDIPAGQYKAVWLKRTVPSSASANASDGMSVRCEGDTV